VLWKSVQFSLLSTLLGGYEVARYIHFLCMSFMVLFVVVHLLMVMLVPRTLLTMLRAR
jgi:thiosulfate reductase cytochrome b subunit